MTTTRFLAGFAAALLLFSSGSAFAFDKKKEAKGRPAPHVVAANRARNVAVIQHNVAVRQAVQAKRARNGEAVRYAVEAKQNRQARNAAAVRYAVEARRTRYAQAATNAINTRNSTNKRIIENHRQYAFRNHSGWRHDHDYDWRGHHYRWYDNAWFIIDPGYYAYSDYPGYYDSGYADYSAVPVSVQVQQVLAQQGYYDGPIDGIVGPGTSQAIAEYQRDNGLRVTGTITRSLLEYLGIS